MALAYVIIYDMIFINCDWVVTWWQWSVHVYTDRNKENNYIHETDTQNSTTQSTYNIRQDIKKHENKHKTNNKRHKHKHINIKQSLMYNKELKDH
jgi:hypothetical protein